MIRVGRGEGGKVGPCLSSTRAALHRPTISRPVQKVSTVSLRRSDSCVLVVCRAELQTSVREDLTSRRGPLLKLSPATMY